MKTSLTLSREVVRGIDRVAGRKHSRSAVIDAVLRRYLSARERAAANARDAEIINRFADELECRGRGRGGISGPRRFVGGAMPPNTPARQRPENGARPSVKFCFPFPPPVPRIGSR